MNKNDVKLIEASKFGNNRQNEFQLVELEDRLEMSEVAAAAWRRRRCRNGCPTW